MAEAGGAGKKRPADEPAKDWEKTLEPVRKLAAILKAVRCVCRAFCVARGMSCHGAGHVEAAVRRVAECPADTVACDLLRVLSRGGRIQLRRRSPQTSGMTTCSRCGVKGLGFRVLGQPSVPCECSMLVLSVILALYLAHSAWHIVPGLCARERHPWVPRALFCTCCSFACRQHMPFPPGLAAITQGTHAQQCTAMHTQFSSMRVFVASVGTKL